MYHCLIVVFLLPLLPAVLCAEEPYPICDTCLPDSVREAPGIGFDLSFSYGTSSVHFYNNTYIPLVHVPANADYQSLLRRLSNYPHDQSPPICDRLCVIRRRLNKFLGRPSTPEVGILSTLLSDLKRDTESLLGVSLTDRRIAMSNPPLTGLSQVDLQDAIEYAGLKTSLDYPPPYPLKLESAPAAYAGNGLGLCDDYLNLYACWDEVDEMRTKYVFAVTFTNAELAWQIVPIRNAFSVWWLAPHPLNTFDVSFYLGLDAAVGVRAAAAEEAEEVDMTSYYWRGVEEYIYSAATHHAKYPITQILLLGEHALHPRFLATLKDALGRTVWPPPPPPPSPTPTPPFPPAPKQQPQSQQKVVVAGNAYTHAEEKAKRMERMVDTAASRAKTVTDPLFAASLGAAVYARRRQEDPYGCEEPVGCRR